MDVPMIAFGVIMVLSYLYAFFSGVGDAANALSTAISTRALTLVQAVSMGAVFQFFGAMLGTGVAYTVSNSIINPEKINLIVVLSAVLSMLIWTFVTYLFSIPVSDTHSLIGSLLGAGLAIGGVSVVEWSGLVKVGVAMFLSPIFGFVGGYYLLQWIVQITHHENSAKMKKIFKNLQIFTAIYNSLVNGLNNAQKPMGIIFLAMILYFNSNTNEPSFWVIISIAVTQAIGVIYGSRLIKTIGMKISALSTEQGFAAQFAASFIIQITSILGIPVSSTQVITTSIVGAGTSRRVGSVRWKVVQEIGLSWLITLPVTIALSYILYVAFSLILYS